MSNRLETLTCEDFIPYLNQTFQISLENCKLDQLAGLEIPGLNLGDAPSLSVTLSEAAMLRPSPLAGRRDEFSLLFRGPKAVTLSPGTYQLAHPEMEPLDLYLTTVQVGGLQDLAFEVVFS